MVLKKRWTNYSFGSNEQLDKVTVLLLYTVELNLIKGNMELKK